MSHLLHTPNPCRSCPFRLKAEGCFQPETLDATVGANIRGGMYVHKCHSTLGNEVQENLCVGFLRFIRDQDIPNNLARMGQRIGVIDYSIISNRIPIAESWDEVLETHAARLRGP